MRARSRSRCRRAGRIGPSSRSAGRRSAASRRTSSSRASCCATTWASAASRWAGSTGSPTSCPVREDRPVEHGHVAGRRAQIRVVSWSASGRERAPARRAASAPRSPATPPSAPRRPTRFDGLEPVVPRPARGPAPRPAGGRVTQRIEAADAYRELGDRVAVDDPASAEVAYRRALDFEPALPDVYVRLARDADAPGPAVRGGGAPACRPPARRPPRGRRAALRRPAAGPRPPGRGAGLPGRLRATAARRCC